MAKVAAEIRRPEILDAAFRVLAQEGLPMPSYDVIAKEAGISRQLIRHYFPDQTSMMVALCDSLAGAYRNLMMKGIIDAASTERLQIFLDFYFGFLEGKGLKKPEDDKVYDAMFSLAAGSPEIRSTLKEQYSLLHFTIWHEVQISNPDIPQRACQEIGYLFVTLMYGHWKMVASLGFSEKHNRIAREAMDRIIASYKANYTDPDA
ncbi:TetR/AcrR family transcriptional regulator [Pseudorhodobacter sp.]|uniref:TetR/AcrR family transcriptional regulator n=1 Tax=Pseudorhodobacter sp. TaxID=1934400 RepID=UPI002AFE5060|nr:TetR/AcrR family transcriptional regulator [Pseudorhodobacter sp.]